MRNWRRNAGTSCGRSSNASRAWPTPLQRPRRNPSPRSRASPTRCRRTCSAEKRLTTEAQRAQRRKTEVRRQRTEGKKEDPRGRFGLSLLLFFLCALCVSVVNPSSRDRDGRTQEMRIRFLALRLLAANLALAACALLLPSCATDGHFSILGYSTRPNYDPNIRTVRVPLFKNKTFMTV